MKAAIVNPYLDTLGGGERYTISLAKVLAGMGYQVDIEWKNKGIKKKIESRFGVKLNDIKIIRNVNRGDGYEICFWVSDGSIPTLKARRNLLHFQVPFHNVNGKTLLNKMKMFRIEKVICNSVFTKNIVDKEYGFKSIVVYPPVDTRQLKPKRKENTILFIGRFSTLKQSKHQDILVNAFKRIYDAGHLDWELVLAGGVEVGVGDNLKKLEKGATGYPIKIIKSPDFGRIQELYGKAKIFWSASGYGIKEDKEPEKLEHFGITIAEAMAAGCVPVVYRAGGHKEIVVDGKNGFLWDNTRKLISTTKRLIKDTKQLRTIGKRAIKDSEQFSLEKFEKEIKKIVLK